MRKYIMKRLLLMLLLLLGMSFIVFGSLYIAPGDPASMVAGPSATEEDIANVRASLGLDKPFMVQYLIYLRKLVTLDLGGYGIRMDTGFETRLAFLKKWNASSCRPDFFSPARVPVRPPAPR